MGYVLSIFYTCPDGPTAADVPGAFSIGFIAGKRSTSLISEKNVVSLIEYSWGALITY